MKKGAVDIELSARGVEVAPPAGACPVLDQETQSLIQRKCRLCGRFYSLASRMFMYGSCRYHPGKYRDPETSGNSSALTGWSCCGVQERVKMPSAIAAMAFMPGVSELVWLNREGQLRDCVGCKVSEEGHVEDLAYSEAMANFPPDIVALRAEHQERLQQFVAAQTPGAPAVEDEASKEKENDETTPPSNSKYFVHKVRKTDTLQGLALHYQVASVDLIRQVNPATIIGDIFQHNEFILIPRKEGVCPKPDEPLSHTDMQKIVIRDFCRAVKCDSKEEATYYCESANFVLADAIATYREDQEAMGQSVKPTPK